LRRAKKQGKIRWGGAGKETKSKNYLFGWPNRANRPPESIMVILLEREGHQRVRMRRDTVASQENGKQFNREGTDKPYSHSKGDSRGEPPVMFHGGKT